MRRDAGMFDVSHMRVVDLEGAGARDFLRYALANNVDKLTVPGKALYSCLLRDDGGVLDDLIVYFLREDFFRLVVNAGTADKDIAWLGRLVAGRAPQLALEAARRPGDDRRAGAERAGEAVAGAARQRSRDRGAEAVLGGRVRRHVHRAHRLHRRGRLRGRAARGLGRAGLGEARRGRRATLRPRRARHAPARGRHEPLRPGHGRVGDAARIRPRLDRRSREPARLRRQGRARREAAGERTARPAAAGQGRRAARPPARAHRARRRRDHQRHLQPDARRVDRARAAAGRGARRRRRPVVVRDRELAARVVKPPFARNGKALVA